MIVRPVGEDPDREGAGTTKDRETETDRDRQGKEARNDISQRN